MGRPNVSRPNAETKIMGVYFADTLYPRRNPFLALFGSSWTRPITADAGHRNKHIKQ